MSKHTIAPVFYPTTCVIIDDNKNFLKRIELSLGKHIICKTFSDPEEALKYIQETSKNNFLLDKVMTDVKSEEYLPVSGDIPIRINTHDLYKHAYDSAQYSEISTVIVDFSMPTMNGIEFCNKLEKLVDSPIKKIMLTGEADETQAVKFFNEGSIDRFILKEGQIDLDESIRQCVAEMQTDYFRDKGYSMAKTISADKDSCLGDSAFIALFEKTCREIPATSYYLLEPSGSFLFLDANGSPTWLIIKTLSELADYFDQMHDMDISKKLTEKVSKGELVPYFQSFDHYMTALEKNTDVEKYFLPAKKLHGKQDYSYAIVKELFDFSLDRGKIISFNKYMSEL